MITALRILLLLLSMLGFLALLAEKRTATVQELCEALNVSESTIRRDLLELDRQGRVNKVHGGATLPSSQFRADEPTMEAKETLAVSQKNTIAKAAAALIQADDFVYLDAGSTTLAVARAVSGAALDAHYVTNGIAHARLLAQKSCHVCVPGGLLRPRTEAIIGAAAITAAGKVYLPLGELIDLDKELARLQKELSNLENEVKRAEGKLKNERFTAKAPERVVAEEREKLEKYRGMLQATRERLASMEALRAQA